MSSYFNKNPDGKTNPSKNNDVRGGEGYMLDSKLWTKRFFGSENGNGQTQFVIGVPTLEHLISSYNKKYNGTYQVEYAPENSGFYNPTYLVRKSSSSDWDSTMYNFCPEEDKTYYANMGNYNRGFWLVRRT